MQFIWHNYVHFNLMQHFILRNYCTQYQICYTCINTKKKNSRNNKRVTCGRQLIEQKIVQFIIIYYILKY